MQRAVVALGGNALLGSDEATTDPNQREHARETVDALDALVERGFDLVLTHGNGPQVGSLLLEQSAADVPERPLDVLVAETQAQVGYVVASEFERVMDARTVTVLTRVRVDADDPAFDAPSKPIGPYYDRDEAAALDFETARVQTPGGEPASRRVVPSPNPTSVVEAEEIRTLVEDGATVVCGGGGGVPIVDDGQATRGVEAVVDKDHTSRLIADVTDAALLVMVTDVPCASREFGTPEQEALRTLSTERAQQLLDAGEFADGSMAPKIGACIDFVAGPGPGDRAVICDRTNLSEALDESGGTTITR